MDVESPYSPVVVWFHYIRIKVLNLGLKILPKMVHIPLVTLTVYNFGILDESEYSFGDNFVPRHWAKNLCQKQFTSPWVDTQFNNHTVFVIGFIKCIFEPIDYNNCTDLVAYY